MRKANGTNNEHEKDAFKSKAEALSNGSKAQVLSDEISENEIAHDAGLIETDDGYFWTGWSVKAQERFREWRDTKHRGEGIGEQSFAFFGAGGIPKEMLIFLSEDLTTLYENYPKNIKKIMNADELYCAVIGDNPISTKTNQVAKSKIDPRKGQIKFLREFSWRDNLNPNDIASANRVIEYGETASCQEGGMIEFLVLSPNGNSCLCRYTHPKGEAAGAQMASEAIISLTLEEWEAQAKTYDEVFAKENKAKENITALLQGIGEL